MSGTATPRTDYSFPTAISHSYPNLDVFAIGTDEALYHKYRDPYSLDDFGPSTLSWEDLGDTNSSQFSTVAAVWRSAADLDVFLVGGDNEMYHKYYSGVTWGPRGGFESREGILTTAPTVVSWDADTLDIFMLGQRGSLWRQTFTKDDGWVNWKELGGDWAKFAPTVVSWGQGRLDYFVVGSDDHALYHGHATTKGTWTRPEDGSLFENRGGYITGRPAAVSSVQGRLDVFARGGDGGLWTTDFQPSGRGWTEWTFLGEDIVGEPEAVSWGPNRIDVFVWKTDFSVGHKYFDGSTWTPELGFENLGGNFSGPPKAAVDKVGSMHVFGYSNKREVLYRSWNEDAKSWVPKDDWKSLGPPR